MAEGSTTCPSCGAQASGRFCSSCGQPLGARHCSGCGTPVATGSRFCANCGAAVAGAPAAPASRAAPRLSPAALAVIGLSVVIGVAGLVWLAGGGGGDPVATPTAATPIAPDISNMTPREQFQRLADRVQAAVESGDRAQVNQFLPMVEGAYQNLLPGDRDIDARFHIALLRAQTGNPSGATAEIDTIMTSVPDHLFGHYLRAIVADIENRPADARAARDAFVAAYREQVASGLPEYDAHKPLLEQFQRESGGTP